MKITKSKLKQLIREEISKVIPEVYYLEPKSKPRAAYQDYENEDFEYDSAFNMQNNVSNILDLHKEQWSFLYGIDTDVEYDPDYEGSGSADKYLERIYRAMGKKIAFLVDNYLKKEENKISAEQLASGPLDIGPSEDEDGNPTKHKYTEDDDYYDLPQ